jgi:hypothetical protein
VNVENQESRLDPLPSASEIVLSEPISIATPTLQSVDVTSLPRSDRQDRNREITTPTTPEPMSPVRPIYDRSNQSLPLLEATLVQDVPDEPVYDAFVLAQGWARIPQKYRVIMVGSILVATAAITAVVVVVLRNQILKGANSLATTVSPSESPSVSPVMVLPTSPPPIIIPSGSPSTITPSASPTTGIPTKAPLVWKRQGPAIFGDAFNDELGASVAVSADARTIVIGAPGYYADDSKKGYVKVYRTNDDSENRVKLGDTIYGYAALDQFGWSVDITANGKTIVIGSPGNWEDNDRPGYVRVFSLEVDVDLGTNAWKQIGTDITGEDDGDAFGWSVSISEDGKTIAVGAPRANGENGDDSGRVRVYQMNDSQSEWVQIGDDIEGEVADDYSGESVSLSADGNKVAIGYPFGYDDNKNISGYVKVYQMDSAGSSWKPLGQTLYGDNSYDYFGRSMNLSPDGNTLAIGSPGNSDRQGYVRVFSMLVGGDNIGTSSWEQIGTDIIGEADGYEFGRRVSLSNDGRTVAVGALDYNGENGDDSGHGRVYRIDDSQSDWIRIGDDIDGEGAHDNAGVSVSLSADGNTVAIGSPYNDDNGEDAGHVRVYVLG